MTTFQAAFYSILGGMTAFLPLGAQTHFTLVPYLLSWPQPSEAFLGAFYLGAFIAAFIYFRHDWASLISCFLQVILFRKRPMTLDERLPIFLGITTIPTLVISFYFQDAIQNMSQSISASIGPSSGTTPYWVSLAFALSALPLWSLDYLNRRNKGMFDWNVMDAICVGITQATCLIPGFDSLSGILAGAFFLNYKRESAVKYAYFASAPLLLWRALAHLKDVHLYTPAASADLTWLSFGVTLTVACFTGILAIGMFIKHIQQKGITQYIFYRFGLALVICTLYWFRNE